MTMIRGTRKKSFSSDWPPLAIARSTDDGGLDCVGRRRHYVALLTCLFGCCELDVADDHRCSHWTHGGDGRRVKAKQQYLRQTPLIIGSFVPVVIISVVSGVAAFVLVRGLGEHASYGVVIAVSLCGVMVIVALYFG